MMQGADVIAHSGHDCVLCTFFPVPKAQINALRLNGVLLFKLHPGNHTEGEAAATPENRAVCVDAHRANNPASE